MKYMKRIFIKDKSIRKHVKYFYYYWTLFIVDVLRFKRYLMNFARTIKSYFSTVVVIKVIDDNLNVIVFYILLIFYYIFINKIIIK